MRKLHPHFEARNPGTTEYYYDGRFSEDYITKSTTESNYKYPVWAEEEQPRRQLHPEFLARGGDSFIAYAAIREYLAGERNAAKMIREWPGAYEQGKLWADQDTPDAVAQQTQFVVSERLELHPEFRKFFPSEAARYDKGGITAEKLERSHPHSLKYGLLWLDQDTYDAAGHWRKKFLKQGESWHAVEPAPKPVCEKHKLPHGFFLHTRYHKNKQEVEWRLTSSWCQVDKHCITPVDNGDEARNFIRTNVAYYREKLGG